MTTAMFHPLPANNYTVITGLVFSRHGLTVSLEGSKQFCATLHRTLTDNPIGAYQFRSPNIVLVTHWEYAENRPMLSPLELSSRASHCDEALVRKQFRFDDLTNQQLQQELRHIRRLFDVMYYRQLERSDSQ